MRRAAAAGARHQVWHEVDLTLRALIQSDLRFVTSTEVATSAEWLRLEARCAGYPGVARRWSTVVRMGEDTVIAHGRDAEIVDLGSGRVLRRFAGPRRLEPEALVMRLVRDARRFAPRSPPDPPSRLASRTAWAPCAWGCGGPRRPSSGERHVVACRTGRDRLVKRRARPRGCRRGGCLAGGGLRAAAWRPADACSHRGPASAVPDDVLGRSRSVRGCAIPAPRLRAAGCGPPPRSTREGGHAAHRGQARRRSRLG